MLHKYITPVLILVLSGFLAGCTKEPQHFNSSKEAVTWYREHFRGEELTGSSSSIAQALYYPKSSRKILIVSFTSSRREYLHEGVPQEVWAGWQQAESKGRFYNSHIKGKYRFLIAR